MSSIESEGVRGTADDQPRSTSAGAQAQSGPGMLWLFTGTTFLSVLALYLFGGEVLHGFAFTMLVGIISGTYSTVFIAAAIAILLSGKQAQGRPQTTRKAS